MKNNDSIIKNIIKLRWSVFIISVIFGCVLCFLLFSLNMQSNAYKEQDKAIAQMQNQINALSNANSQLTFEMEQLGTVLWRTDTITPDNILQQKIDSLERVNHYNAVFNQLKALNGSAISQSRIENQKLYDDYLTHINTMLAVFGVLIAVISIFVPYLINKKTDDIIKEHEKRLSEHERHQEEIKNIIQNIANDAEESANKALAYSLFTQAKGEYGNRAIDLYTQAIEIFPTKDAFNNRGNAYSKRHRFDLAIIDYNSAIEMDTNYADAYYNRGNTYYCMHEYNKAILDFNKSIALNEDDAEAYISRGATYLRKGVYEKAIDDFKMTLELDPDYFEAYCNLGDAFFAKDNYDNALVYYTKFIEKRPKDAYAYNNRGCVFIKTNELDLAQADFDRAIELCPNNPEYFDSRADLFIVLKEYEKALEDVKVGLSLKPSEDIHELLMKKKEQCEEMLKAKK